MTLSVVTENLKALFDSVNKVVSGVFASALGYFLPIKDMVHVIIIFFVIDMLVGWWAAHTCRGESFSKTIVFNTTIPRMLISILLEMILYTWDTTFNQTMFSTYRVVGWYISGVLILSIIKNGYKATKWKVIPKIGDIIKEELNDIGKLKDK